MDARKLNAIMTAIDLGSFSKAAETVGYTQSGLTHLVNSLEKELGFARSYISKFKNIELKIGS